MTTTTAEYSPSAALPVLSRVQSWIWPAATVAVLSVAYGPMLAEFGQQQWARPHYQYFPFVIGAFIWLLWRNCSVASPRQVQGRSKRIGSFVFLAAAWLLLALAYVIKSPWLAVASANMLVASRLLLLSAHWNVKYLWGIWAILWLIVPLPLNRDQHLIIALQHLSSRLSSAFLDAAGVEHLMDGNTLLLPDKQLFVDEACSGIVSVLSVIACAVIYGVWKNRLPVHVVALAFAGIGWATFMNVLRITVIAIMWDKTGTDWSSGTSHEILSLVIFAFILFGLVSTDMLLIALLLPIESTWNQLVAAPVRFGQSVVRLWDRMMATNELLPNSRREPPPRNAVTALLANRMTLRLVPLAAFGVLAALEFSQFSLAAKNTVLTTTDSKPFLKRALACSAETLPPKIGQLQRAQFLVQTRERDDALGNYSRTYEYRSGEDSRMVASCDFPYQGGWHELTVCYRGQGWELDDRRVITEPANDESSSWPYLEADFSKPDGANGYLLASAFDDAGNTLDLPGNSFADDFLEAFTNRNKPTGKQLTFQVQVWTTAGRAITQREREAARKLLFVARQKFFQHITQSNELSSQQASASPQ